MRVGFLLILEPFETENATVPNPIFHLTCLDPSLAIKPVFERFSSVVITSGTISPLDMYPKMLQFTPVVQETYAMTLTRNSFLPLVLSLLSFAPYSVVKGSLRSLLVAVIKSQSALDLKSGTIQQWSETLGAFSSSSARLYQMALQRSSRAIYIWNQSSLPGMTWYPFTKLPSSF
jgi:hypothetical protein